MTIRLETYHNIAEKEERLAGIYKKHGDRAVFVVPGGLDKELLTRLIAGGGSFMGRGPAVWTWSDLYREAARGSGAEYLRVIDPPDHNLIISYVLESYLSGAKAGADLPPGVTRRGFATVLGDNLRELMNEEVAPEQMRGLLNIDGGTGYEPEAILCRLYGDYLAYLAENNIADSAQIPTLTRAALALPAGQGFISERVFVFVGFLTFTGGQRRLIETIRAAGECWFVLPESGIDDYYDAIRQIGADYSERPKWSVGVWRVLASGEHTQFEALARELALWLAGGGDLRALGQPGDYGEIGVMVEPRSLRTLLNAMSRYKIPYSAQVRESAGDTLAWQLLREIWEAWVSGWSPGKTLSLMTNPLLDSGYGVSHNAGKFPEGREAWISELKGKALEMFRSVEKLCLAFEKGGTPPEVMALWRDFLNTLEPGDTLAAIAGDDISLDTVIRDNLAVIRELDTKIEVLRDMRRDIGEAAAVNLAGSDAVSYLLGWGRTAKLPIGLPQSRSVTVYAGIPPVLSRHRYWVMTGVDYNSWPGTLRESPLLRDAAKKILNGGDENEETGGARTDRPHMPEIHEQRQQKEALFRRLLATAERGVILTRSVTDQSGRPSGESQFTEALFDPEKYDRDRLYIDLGKTEYPASRMLPRSGDPWFPRAEVPSWSEKLDRGDFPRSVKGAAEREKIYVALSALDDWNKCPFFYWCRKEARLETPQRGIYDYLRSGTMMHKLWEDCWRERLEKGVSITQLVVTRWDGVVRQSYPELVSDRRLRRYGIELRRQALSLAETQDAIEERMRGREAVEIEYTLPEYEIDGVVFVGRADRIDFFDGGAVVLDYKAGNSASYKKNLQLAAYAAVLREQTGLAPYGYGWFGLRDSSLSGCWNDDCLPIYRENARSTAGFEAMVDKALELMRGMAKTLREGVFRANYSHPDCKACEFSSLCRRKEYPLYQLEDEEGEEGGDE